MARILDIKPQAVKSKKNFFQKGIAGVKEGFTSGGGKSFIDPFIGAGKGALSTLSGLSELGQRGLRAVTPSFGKEQEIAKIPEKFTEAKGGFQKAGKLVEQVGEFALPGAFGLKAGKGARLGTRVLEGALTTGGITAAQEGKVGKEAVVGAALGGAMPLVGATLKGITGGTKRLIRKATGLTPSQSKQLNIIAKTTDPNTGKPIYNSIEEFVTKKGIVGKGKEVFSRTDMKNHAESLLETTMAHKKDLINQITRKAPNKYQKVINLLNNKVSSLSKANEGVLDDEAKFLKGLGKKKLLSAKEIDKVRSIADDLVYSETDNLLKKKINALIKPLRGQLDKLDKSETLKIANTDIRLLQRLIGNKGFLTAAAEKDIAGKASLFGGAALAASAVPGLGQVASPVIGYEALTSIPQVAAPLARGIQATTKAITPEINAMARGLISKQANR